MDKEQEIIDILNKYQEQFIGVNEANIHASHDIAKMFEEQAKEIKELKAALERTKNLFSVIEYNGKVLDEINELLKTK